MAKYKAKNTEHYLRHARQFLAGYPDTEIPAHEPRLVKQAHRARIVFRDNQVYTDYCLGQGSLILGHAHRNVVLGVKKIAERGLRFDALSIESINLAGQIARNLAGIDKVAFYPCYQQSLQAAVTAARAYTGKRKVITFELCSASGMLSQEAETLILPFNDVTALQATLKAQAQQIACVVLEAVTAAKGVIAARLEFLSALKELQKDQDIIVILDEHKTGFRTNPAGAAHDFNLNPEVICLSGIMGGGFPLSALGLRGSLSGCLPGNAAGPADFPETADLSPVMLRAGLSTLKVLDHTHYTSLNAKAQQWGDQMNAFFQEKDIKAHIAQYKSMLSLFFAKEAVCSDTSATRALDAEKYLSLRRYLLRRGILFPQVQQTPFFITLSHSRKETQELLTSLKNFFTVS